jgi:GT2 family glycosyltransferase
VGVRVIVVILDYNAAGDTLACLRSVLAGTHPDLHVLVCDNGSRPASVEALRDGLAVVTGEAAVPGADAPELPRGSSVIRHGPRVTLIQLPVNLGYAGGNNACLRVAMATGRDPVLLLNNDVTVKPDTIARLLEVLESDRSLGVVGALNIDADDHRSILEEGIRMDLVRFDALRVPARETGFDRVDKVIGASMLISSDALRHVGLLDERFFLYWEDTDYCFRASAKGYGVAVSYDARVHHKRHGTSNERVRSYFMTRNSFLFLASHLPWHRRLVPGFLVLGRGVKDVLLHFLVRRDGLRARAIAHGLLDGLLGRTGKGRLDDYYR